MPVAIWRPRRGHGLQRLLQLCSWWLAVYHGADDWDLCCVSSVHPLVATLLVASSPLRPGGQQSYSGALLAGEATAGQSSYFIWRDVGNLAATFNLFYTYHHLHLKDHTF